MDSDQEDVCDGGLLNCPKCSMPFKHKRSLAHHIDYRCKADKLNNILTETRRPSKIPATEIRVDSEADHLLDTVDSPYAQWRLSQLLGVTQRYRYPIVFHHNYPGSKSSMLSMHCPTTDPVNIMVGILVDAKNNFDIEEITMPSNAVVIGPNGVTTDISKGLLPSNFGVLRSNRPKIVTEERNGNIVYRLGAKESEDANVNLVNSVENMSISENLDVSVSSTNFAPAYKSSPLPLTSLQLISSVNDQMDANQNIVGKYRFYFGILSVVREGFKKN